MNQKYSNRYFQFLRGILICIVIFIHCMYENNNVYINIFNIIIRNIINIAVPIFIFISGYFTNKEKVIKNPKKYIINRVKRLLIPLIIYSTLYSFIITVNDFNNKNFIFDFFKKIVIFSSAPQLYYIIVLIQMTILTPLILKYSKNNLVRTGLFLITPIYLIALGIMRIVFEINIPFYQFYFLGWLIYYLIGLELQNKKDFKIKKNIFGSSVILLISIIINICLYIFNNSTYTYVTSQLNIMNMIYVLILIPIIVYAQNNYKTNKFTKGLEKIGDVSFVIYFIHYIIIMALQKFLLIKLNSFILQYLISFVITLTLSYFIAYLLQKIKNETIKKYIGI